MKAKTSLKDDPRVKEWVDHLRQTTNLDQAIHDLALAIVVVEDLGKFMHQSIANDKLNHARARAAELLTDETFRRLVKAKTDLSENGKAAANALHDKPGGTREKQASICAIWASGKYTNRDLCAEQECAFLNMSISTARRALRNTPEPPSRCTV